jgi:hypothetical protein
MENLMQFIKSLPANPAQFNWVVLIRSWWEVSDNVSEMSSFVLGSFMGLVLEKCKHNLLLWD